jgi:hypothetical protein
MKVVPALEDQRLRVFENKFITKIIVPKREQGKE